MNFDALTHAALLGTARGSPPPGPGGTTLGNLIQAVDSADAECALLSRAAITFLHGQAGRLPSRDLQSAPVAAAAESLPRVNPAAAGHLARILSGENPELLPEWLRLCAASHHLAPPELLPALLSCQDKDEALNALKLPVLGERGRWLAAAAPAWSWVRGAADEDDSSAWETGEAPARRSLLRRLRLRDPAKAREVLASTWSTDTPGDRAAFINTIGLNLQPEDEPFLQSALADKRKEVRTVAFAMLSRLPQSAFAQRMLARVEPLLTLTPGVSGSLLKLKKAQPAVLEARLPNACDKDMQSDAIEPKPPKGTGEKTWWLMQLLTGTPLTAWESRWNQPPAALIAAAQQSESGADILHAWNAAARAQQNAAWAEALLAAAPEGDLYELMAILPPATRERWCVTLFKSESTTAAGPLLQSLLREPSGDCWSREFSHALLDFLRTLCAGTLNYSDYVLRNQLRLLALRLDPVALLSAPAGWPSEPGEAWTFWQPAIEAFLQLGQVRTDMIESLRGKS